MLSQFHQGPLVSDTRLGFGFSNIDIHDISHLEALLLHSEGERNQTITDSLETLEQVFWGDKGGVFIQFTNALYHLLCL